MKRYDLTVYTNGVRDYSSHGLDFAQLLQAHAMRPHRCWAVVHYHGTTTVAHQDGDEAHRPDCGCLFGCDDCPDLEEPRDQTPHMDPALEPVPMEPIGAWDGRGDAPRFYRAGPETAHLEDAMAWDELNSTASTAQEVRRALNRTRNDARCHDCNDPAPVGLYQCAPCHKRARDENDI